jgi:hypothetical protein
VKLYLAAAFARQDEADIAASFLEQEGHTIVSTWHKPGVNNAVTAGQKRLASAIDLEDMLKAEGIVCFTEPENDTPFSSGGRHFEAGFMFALGHVRPSQAPTMVVVGPIENVYYSSPRFIKCQTLPEAAEQLAMEGVRRARAKAPR